jgi:hypothetical protein
MTVMNTSNFENTSLSISKNIKILTAAAYQVFQQEYPSLIPKETTTLKIDKQMRYEGAGASPEKAEGDSAAQTEIKEGYVERVNQATFVYEMPITWEQRKFAVKNANFIGVIGTYMARSVLLRYEYKGVEPLQQGFATGAYAAADTKAYFADDHAFKVGGTYDNLLTTALLAKTSLETALKDMANAKMEFQVPANLRAKRVVIQYENIFVLPELLKSNLDPESGNNTYNAIQDFSLKKVLSHYNTNSNDWFIDSQQDSRVLKEAQAPLYDQYTNDSTNDLVERSWTSIGAGHHDQLYSFGNQGA